jgi:hypothetical protein
MSEPNPTPAGLLLEQYKLLEGRRQFFSNQFLKMTGGVSAIFTLLVGLPGRKAETESALHFAIFVGGVAYILLAYLGHLLGKRQDDCESVMSEIESTLKMMDYPTVARMPSGTRRNLARRAVIVFLAGLGMSLLVAGFIK